MGASCSRSKKTVKEKSDRKEDYKPATVLSGSELKGKALKKAILETTDESGNPKGLEGPRKWQSLTVSSVKVENHNSLLISLLLPHPEALSGLKPSNHISVRNPSNGTARSYTPVSDPFKDKGRMDLLVKIYPKGAVTGGFLGQVKAGDKVEVCGPRGRVDYRKKGVIYVDKSKLPKVKKIGCISGGTGIAPVFSLVRAIAEDDESEVECFVLTSNSTGKDTLFNKQLNAVCGKSERVHCRHTVSRDPPRIGWKGYVGRVTEQMLKESMPTAKKGVYIFMCGPFMFQEHCAELLVKLGHKDNRIYRF